MPAAVVPGVQSALTTAELSRRASRPPDFAAENRALVALARAMVTAPDNILQTLAETALVQCRAHSAGLSLLEDGDQRRRFHWRAIAGEWTEHVGGGTPREFGPCGTVLDCNAALLFSHPERDFPYFGEVTPLLEEGLLVPFYVRGEAVGTIWVVAHDQTRRFDAEDFRVLTNLATFAASAYENRVGLAATRRFAEIIESADEAIISKTLGGVITTWNPGAEQLFGYAAAEIIGRPIATLIPPERETEERAIIERIARGERVERHDTVRRHKDGRLVPVSLMISPIKDANGQVLGASKFVHDISDRKRNEEHIALLNREVDHRAKNLLALVQAIVHLADGETADDVKTVIQGRVRALANAHTLLEQSHWMGADLASLVAAELSPYSKHLEAQAEIDGPRVMLRPRSAQSVAVALHELATNAAKYGALSVKTGEVRVAWSHAPDGRLVIVWTESNGPPVDTPLRRGVGTRVIEQIVGGELKGRVSFHWRHGGLVCELSLDPAIETATVAT